MAIAGKHGVTSTTPQNIAFGAGTIHKNLKYTDATYSKTSDVALVDDKDYYTRSGTSPNYTYTKVASPNVSNIGSYYELTAGGWNFDTSIIGATSGGSKCTITPEISNIEVDGALVKIKDISDVKTGGTATMEVNFLELNKEVLKRATLGQDGTSADDGYDLIEDKALIESGDYLENIAFVGKTLDGRKIIVILDNALCTNGMEMEGKNKEAGVIAMTFECYADNEGGLDTLPWHIYYPKTAQA